MVQSYGYFLGVTTAHNTKINTKKKKRSIKKLVFHKRLLHLYPKRMVIHAHSRFIVLILETEKRLEMEKKENDIIYSKAIKAGKRIYYLDVKKSRNDDLYLSITESKKRIMGTDDAQVSYEKHKIFLYKEDFGEFTEGLEDVIGFIKRELGTPIIPRAEYIEKANANETPIVDEEPREEEKTQKRGFFDKFF